ncbi:MAG: inactive transglutaminase family protein [Gammaproteobacteria bacterium]
MSRRYLLIITTVLTLVAVTMFAYKWRVIGLPLAPDQKTTVWTVEATINFLGGPGSIKANLQLPTLTPGYTLLTENSVSRGYGFSVNLDSGGREAQWAIRRADGPQTLYYRAVVYEDDSSRYSDTTPPFPPAPSFEEPFDTAMQVLVAEVREQSADPASFTAELLHRLNDPTPDPNVELLRSLSETPAGFVLTVTRILAAARTPARMLRGIMLKEQSRHAEILPWLEIHDGIRWLYFDPRSGEEGLPDDYLVWWRGSEPLATVEGGSGLEVTLAVRENQLDTLEVAEQRAEQRRSRLVEFSLFSLPIQTQAVYSVLLMIPIGALVMVIMRNFIGVQTFGTFMPVLIALAFRETQLLWGIILFTLLVSLGLSIRFLLERLRLLLVPRLTAVLIVVVLLMLLISIVFHKLGIETGLSVALFPMVIIAMTIERMSVVWEERGPEDAIKAGLGSLIVAALAYLAMGIDWLQHLVFTFPELLLIVLALVLLAGRYTGYRLTELPRFRGVIERG